MRNKELVQSLPVVSSRRRRDLVFCGLNPKRRIVHLLLLGSFAFLLFSCNPFESAIKERRIEKLTELALQADTTHNLSLAIKYYTQILQIDSTKRIALVNRGRVYLSLGDMNKAFTDIDKAVQYWPDSKTYEMRGAYFYKLKEYDKAIEDFNTAMRMDAEAPAPYFWLASVHVSRGEYDKAMQLVKVGDSKLKVHHDTRDYDQLNVLSHQAKANVYLLRKEYRLCILESDTLIHLLPNVSAYYNNRGYSKLCLGQYKEALPDLDKAIELNPQMAFSYNNKGYALFKLDKPEEGLALVEKSLLINNKNAYAFKNRAEIFIDMYRMKEACSDLASAKLLNTDPDLGKEISELEKNCR